MNRKDLHGIRFALVWAQPVDSVQVSASGGRLRTIHSGPDRAVFEIADANLREGPPGDPLMLRGDCDGSFFLRDLRPERPMVAPVPGFAVVGEADHRSFAELLDSVASDSEALTGESQISFGQAAAASEPMVAPTWLGLGGDARVFLASFAEDHGCWGWVTPYRYHKNLVCGEEKIEWDFTVGRGSQYRHRITRHLEEGCLPIVHSTQDSEPVTYELTLLASTDTADMTRNPPRGTEWRAAYMSAMGCMFSDEEQEALSDHLWAETTKRSDQPVFCLRVVARNNGDVPAFAWYRMPMYKPGFLPPMYPPFSPLNQTLELDSSTGLCLEGDRVFSINRLNGGPLPNEEISVLIDPGESAVFEAYVPWVPIPPERAGVLQNTSFGQVHGDCREYWLERLAPFPRWKLPEAAIEERLRAGTQHLLMNTLGERMKPDAPLLATVGVYAPIGTESTPILWFLDAMGQHETVRRSLDYFFEIQRDDGYIQSFNHYDAETGPVLALVWHHYRLTGDSSWIEDRKDGIVRACRYLIARRATENAEKIPDTPGFGMISGKTADPDEYFAQFVLNAQAVDGLAGAAKVLDQLGDAFADTVAKEAEDLRTATLSGFARAIGDAPLVPAANGTWAPMIGGWPGTPGEVSLYAERGRWFTHGSFHMRALAFLHLTCFGVLPADDPRLAALVNGLEHNVLLDHTGPSQPYGRRLDFYYLATNRINAFLELYYRQIARLQDRETYTFWEHYYKLSSQKTHEEAWFLQQTCWMLCFPEKGGLTLLKGIPTAWLEPGKMIDIQKIHTVYGQVALKVCSTEQALEISVRREKAPVQEPSRMGIRIPYDLFGSSSTGRYDPATGILELDPGRNHLELTVRRSGSEGN